MPECSCGCTFFIEHKRAFAFRDAKLVYFHLFHDHPSLDVKYSVVDCSRCRSRYILRKTYEGQAEQLIPVELFSGEDAMLFLTRAKILTDVLHYTESFVGNMVRNDE